MRCPFLQEAEVSCCRRSAFPKMIERKADHPVAEKCSSAGRRNCPAYEDAAEEDIDGPCPFLEERLVQFCGAAAVRRFIPYSEGVLSRCGASGHRYCGLYLALAHPPEAGPGAQISAPHELYYSANHMWLDLDEDGGWHAGIDALLARLAGRVERIHFVTLRGLRHPAAVLTAGGRQIEVVFPNPLYITGANLYLRADPAKLTGDPYGLGWLFEGREPGDSSQALRGLIPGEQAAGWMRQEAEKAGL